MKRLIFWIFAFASMAAISCAQSALSAATVVIDDVTVIDATGAPALPHRTVVVRDGHILEITKPEDVHAPKIAAIHVDGRERFFFLGAWHMTVHTIVGIGL